MTYVIPALIVGLCGMMAGILLTVAAKVFHVEVDERIEKIGEALPQANCGACGYAGCADYAVPEEQTLPERSQLSSELLRQMLFLWSLLFTVTATATQLSQLLFLTESSPARLSRDSTAEQECANMAASALETV